MNAEARADGRTSVWLHSRTAGLRDQRGSVIVLLALTLTIVMGMAAITVDLGRAWVQDVRLQAAADAAALGGARELSIGSAAAIAAAEALLQANGVTLGIATITVETTNSPDDTLRVRLDDTATWLFAPAIGFAPQQAVGAEAAALRQNVLAGGYALFAGSPSCGDAIRMSGSDIAINGGVHSNDDIKVSGSNNTVTGGTVHAGSIDVSGSGNTFTPAPIVGAVDPYPVTFDIADYAPGGAMAIDAGASYYNAGSNKIDTGWLISQGLYNPSNGVLADGLYYTSDDIDLNGSDLTGNVTFVTSNDEIHFSGSNHNLQPWDAKGPLAFSNETDSCSNHVVKFSGSGSSWSGIVYAPNGRIEMSGSGNSNVDGALIGMAVKLTGSSASITNTGGYSFGTASVSLIS